MFMCPCCDTLVQILDPGEPPAGPDGADVAQAALRGEATHTVARGGAILVHSPDDQRGDRFGELDGRGEQIDAYFTGADGETDWQMVFLYLALRRERMIEAGIWSGPIS